MNLDPSQISSKANLQMMEMPILLVCPGAGEEIEADWSDWRHFLDGIQEAVFSCRDADEAVLLLHECEKLGTPVGVVLILGESWAGTISLAAGKLRKQTDEYSRQIFVACRRWSRIELYDSVDAGVSANFAAPWDWGLIERKTRSALSAAFDAQFLLSQKVEAEDQLMQHKQSILHQDLWRLDLQSRTVEFNENFRKMSGFSQSEVKDNLDECLMLIHPFDLSRLTKTLTGSDWRSMPEELNFEFRLRHLKGGWRWVLMRGKLERNASGEPVAISGSHTDITEAKTIDPITGLANRLQFENWLGDYRQADRPSLAVFLVSIDRYSMIRDSLGQAVGDQLARLASERLGGVLNAGVRQDVGWILARLNEEEFGIAMPGMEDGDSGRKIGELIQVGLAKGTWLQGNELFLSASVGYVLREEGWLAEEIWRDAEIALREASSGGGNRVVRFDSSMRKDVLERMALENDLKRAIEQWEFEVYYQPKVELATERIIGFEALLRWQHPAKGIILPNQFIPLAEDTGLIIPIGIRTVREACQTIRAWQDQFPQQEPLEVSVNLSVRQFQDRHLLDDIQTIIAETQIIPSTLQFEVTESVLVKDPDQALEIVKGLRRMGAGLKIDDFGTGYSSLSYLHKLPFDTLKIDRSFISMMCEDHAAYEIVRAIIQLAGSLGLHVVAEGIETRKQADALRALGCGSGQGYLYAPALTRDAARQMLETQALKSCSCQF